MTKEFKFDKEEFKKMIGTLADGFDKEHMKSPIFDHIVDNAKWLDTPDHIHTMIMFPFRRSLELAINMTQKQKQEVTSLWLNYTFLENNISELCSQFYGHGCCVDRGSFIVNSYIKFVKTGVMPKLDWKQDYPEKGTLKQWFDVVAGLQRLKYGYNKEYLFALKKIMEVHGGKKK